MKKVIPGKIKTQLRLDGYYNVLNKYGTQHDCQTGYSAKRKIIWKFKYIHSHNKNQCCNSQHHILFHGTFDLSKILLHFFCPHSLYISQKKYTTSLTDNKVPLCNSELHFFRTSEIRYLYLLLHALSAFCIYQKLPE